MPAPPPSLPLRDAIDRNDTLASLLQRLDQSRRRFDAIAPLLPEGLRASVRPGPVDETGWTLLADHGAAAAKLRQLLPRVEQALLQGGWPPLPLRLRIQPRG
jgi:hypothetical protein